LGDSYLFIWLAQWHDLKKITVFLGRINLLSFKLQGECKMEDHQIGELKRIAEEVADYTLSSTYEKPSLKSTKIINPNIEREINNLKKVIEEDDTFSPDPGYIYSHPKLNLNSMDENDLKEYLKGVERLGQLSSIDDLAVGGVAITVVVIGAKLVNDIGTQWSGRNIPRDDIEQNFNHYYFNRINTIAKKG